MEGFLRVCQQINIDALFCISVNSVNLSSVTALIFTIKFLPRFVRFSPRSVIFCACYPDNKDVVYVARVGGLPSYLFVPSPTLSCSGSSDSSVSACKGAIYVDYTPAGMPVSQKLRVAYEILETTTLHFFTLQPVKGVYIFAGYTMSVDQAIIKAVQQGYNMLLLRFAQNNSCK